MAITADRNDYCRAYRKHYQAYKCLHTNNDCSISRRLLLVYCVECGLKYQLMSKWRLNNTQTMQNKEYKDTLQSHRLEDMLKALGQAGTFRFPKSVRTAHGDVINDKNFHEMCRYGIKGSCKSHGDESKFVAELEKIAKWLEEGM